MRIVLDDGAYMPVRGHETDAGMDLLTVILPIIIPDSLEQVESLEETERGNNGFGSTGGITYEQDKN